jgi:hypothetical protein
MNFAAFSRIFFVALLLAFNCLAISAQGLQVDVEEFKRLQGEVADLRDANVAYQKRISELTRRLEKLQEDVREGREHTTIKMGDFVTRDELKKIVERIAEVDSKRENDRKVILEEFEKLGKTLASAPASETRNGTKRNSRDREKEPEKQKETKPEIIEGNFLPYKVRPNETFSEILDRYNKQLTTEGRPGVTTAMVKKANPKLNPDRIFKDQEILLPVPEKK